MLEGYRFIQQFQVIFRDIDMMQHVNHTAYVRWAEGLRSNYFVENFGESIMNGERAMILAKIEFVYERQILLREQVAIGCRVSRVGTRSLDFSYEVWSVDHTHRCATAVTTMVAYNYPQNHTIDVPLPWREAILAYETSPIAGT